MPNEKIEVGYRNISSALGKPTMPHFKLIILLSFTKIQRRDFNTKAA